MQPLRSVSRRRLDQRLAGLGDVVGPRPARGWIRAIREALGMSTFELAGRMGVTQSRVSQLERAEAEGSVRLATLERVAAALDCRLHYVLVPNDPLELMVRRQAREKALQTLTDTATREGLPPGDRALLDAVMAEQVDALAHELVDRRGLWRASRTGPA